MVCREAHSLSRLRREILQIFPNLPNTFFHHYLFVRFVQICKIYSPDGSSTRLSAGHSLPVGFAEKSHKSFQIFQIFFYHYLFVRFVPICKISVPRGTLSSGRLRREISQIFPNLPNTFFHHYLFVRFVQMFPEHRERGICCAPHPR